MLLMIAKHVTNVLAKKALDALAKFLHAVDVRLLHSPRSVRGVRRSWFEFLYPLLDLVIPRYVADQIFHRRKRPYRFDRYRFIERDRIQPSHTHQLWLTVDFRRARPALAGLAVPAA